MVKNHFYLLLGTFQILDYLNYNDLLLERLRQELCELPFTKRIGLGDNQKWRQSHFQTFARSLNQQLESKLSKEQQNNLGTTVSVSTLERIFKHGYKIPTPIDGRRLKTLNKLAITIGYTNWNGFSNAFLDSLRAKPPAPDFKSIIKNALEAEFQIYKSIPHINLSLLEKYFSPEGSALTKIKSVLESITHKGLSLKNKHNPSTFELLEINAQQKKNNEVWVYTKEYWYLNWYSPKRKKYEHRYNVINDQVYILTKTKQGWKIRVNIYNAANLE